MSHDAPAFHRRIPKFLQGLSEDKRARTNDDDNDAGDFLDHAVLLDATSGKQLSPTTLEPAANMLARHKESASDWTHQWDSNLKMSFFFNTVTQQRLFSKPAILLSEREKKMPQCPIVEFIETLVSTYINLDTMESFDVEPAALVQHRQSLAALAQSDPDEDVRFAATEALKATTVDKDRSLERLAKLTASSTITPTLASASSPGAAPRATSSPRKAPAAPPSSKFLLSFSPDED